MKLKKLAIVASIVSGLVLNAAMATEVAFVDVQKVVASSGQVKALKKEQETKAKELQSFVEKAKKEVAAVSDTKKKQELAEKYDKEYVAKTDKLKKNYAEKLQIIEKSISNVISQQAKLKGYDMVVAKDVVLYGSTDITEDVIKVVEKDNVSVKSSKSKK